MSEESTSWALSPAPKRRRHHRAAVFGVSLAAFLVATLALAAWTAQTTGNKAAGKYGTLQGVTGIAAEAFTTGDCFPSSTCTLTIRASNPNPQAVTLASVDTTGYTVTGNGGCTTPAASLAASYVVGQSVPGGGQATIDIPNGVTIGAGASNDCQGATVTFDGLTFNTST
jgi:hypothetical protein